MKPYLAILAGLVVAAPGAWAQVTINQAALDQLAGIPPVVITAPPALRQAPRRVTYRPVVHHHVTEKPTILASSSMPKPVALPKAAPAGPIAQQVVAKPAIPLPAPKPVAPPANVEIVFAAGAADLPPGTSAELKAFCAKPAPSGFITIDAYAAADPNDPSVAPRLSLSRAFALRDALVACGVPSASIIPRADGVGKNPDIAQVSVAP